MKIKHPCLAAVTVLTLLVMVSCRTVPVTGRSQLSLVSDSQVRGMSLQAYDEFLSQHEVITGTKEAAMVQNVGERISKAVESYLASQNLLNKSQFAWEFNLIEDKAMNAWAMPGGKVVVYTGILPVTRDETGLAVVMSHEIAHVVAGHGAERMSQGLLTELGGMALSTALSSEPQRTQDLYMTAYGLGAQVGVLLPYSRLHESEADHLGLIFMAIAGYDPNEAVGFWQRMSESAEGKAPPEFLSTHPSDKKRIQQIRKWIPEAMKYYREK
ncbi:MAG: M48 family metallopeptidase [Pseudomonadota bacterium]